MKDVTIRELRNHGGAVADRVLAGESLRVTRSGRPVAELRPIRPAGLAAEELLRRWRRLPRVDIEKFRSDIDSALDPTL